MKWTAKQNEAITTKNKNLLISAAAGSGKTAVLTERIIKLIVEEKIPITRMLIVTFTNAASYEMKDRIQKKLMEYEKEYPNDEFVKTQLQNIHNANISTLHSFCINVIRKYFNIINIDPNFKIASTSYLNILRDEVINEIFTNHYEQENKNFLSLIDIYTSRNTDEELIKLVYAIYYFIQSQPEPIKWLEDKCDVFKFDKNQLISSNIYQTIKNNNMDIIDGIFLELKTQQNIINQEMGPKPYLKTWSEDYEYFSTLKTLLENDFDKYQEYLSSNDLSRLATIKKAEKEAIDEQLTELYKEIRNNNIKDKGLKKLKNNLFEETLDELVEKMNLCQDTILNICNLVKEFNEEFSKKKLSKSLLDFNDLEHYTIKILKDEQSRNQISDSFDYIFFDEYQDSNLVQETIINKIKKEDNLFFVGDIKQSIYGFRLAEPKLFINKYNLYEKDEKSHKIDLSENFRSTKQIIDFCNCVFEKIMSKDLGGVNYDENSRLYTKSNYEINPEKISLNMVVNPTSSEYSKEEAEAIMTAHLIKDLINNKKTYFNKKTNTHEQIRYSDIAIIMRSVKQNSEAYKKIFTQENIPFYLDYTTAVFDNLEIQLLIDFLKLIDNPIQDTPLISSLNSIFGNFTIEEISEIRSKTPNKSFYIAFNKYPQIEDNNIELSKKINVFNETILELQNQEKNLKLSDFIQYVIEKFHYRNFITAMPGGDSRAENLDQFIAKAIEFEENPKNSLYHFLIYIDKIMTGKADDYTPKLLSPEDNRVTIMSIHKSKGLEYSVIFLNDIGRQFNFNDTKSDILLDSNIGFGPNYNNINLNTYTQTIARKAIELKIKNEVLSEEMRILYVAFTRAEEYLYLNCCVRTVPDTTKQKYVSNAYNNLFFSQSFLDWILIALNNTENKNLYSKNIFEIEKLLEKKNEENETFEKLKEEIELFKPDEEKIKEMIEQYDFKYKYTDEINIAAKDSVTSITSEKNKERFYNIKKLDELSKINFTEKKLDSAQIGTLTHFIIQHLDYKKDINKEKIDQLIETMLKNELMTQEEYEALDKNLIYNFINSPIFKRIQQSKKIFKEQSFITQIDKTVVNGVIDLFFEEDDQIVVLDFKTDNVNLENYIEKSKKYENQILMYKEALEKSFNKKVKNAYIYFLKIEKEVDFI